MRLLLKQAPVVALHCVGIMLGIVAGVLMARSPNGAGVADVVSAFLGAAIAVFGAMWATEHREDVERRNLRAILAGGVQKLLVEASAAHELTNSAPVNDGRLTEALRGMLHRWEHVGAFSPYRELGSFALVSVMSDVDAACRALIPLLDEEHPRAYTNTDFMMARMISRERTNKTVHQHAENVAANCEAALRALK